MLALGCVSRCKELHLHNLEYFADARNAYGGATGAKPTSSLFLRPAACPNAGSAQQQFTETPAQCTRDLSIVLHYKTQARS